MDTISASQFKATCLGLLDEVYKKGKTIQITKHGKVVAQLIPPRASKGSGKWLGCGAGTGKIVGDITTPATDESEWKVLRS